MKRLSRQQSMVFGSSNWRSTCELHAIPYMSVAWSVAWLFAEHFSLRALRFQLPAAGSESVLALYFTPPYLVISGKQSVCSSTRNIPRQPSSTVPQNVRGKARKRTGVEFIASLYTYMCNLEEGSLYCNVCLALMRNAS